MNEATESFLERVRTCRAIESDELTTKVRAALEEIAETTAEAYSLLVAYQDVEFDEDDPLVRGALGEYEQTLGAIERVGKELREKWKYLRRAMKELEDLEERLGSPIRETGEVPESARRILAREAPTRGGSNDGN